MNFSLREKFASEWWPRIPFLYRQIISVRWKSLTYHWASRFPAPYAVLVAGALAANQRRDPKAPVLWRSLIHRYPGRGIGYAGLATAQRLLGQSEIARSTFVEALERFPKDPVLLWEYGHFLIERGDNEAACEVYERAGRLRADRPEPVLGVATAMRRLRRFDEADAKLLRARGRFPRIAAVWCEYANNAEARGDHEETLRRWRETLTRFPNQPISYAGLGSALSKIQRHDEAEAALVEGLRRFPDDINLRTNAAWAAVARADWGESKRRWDELVEWAPHDLAIRAAASEAEMHARLAEADDAARTQAGIEAAERAAQSSMVRQMMMRFESIGENCELGFVHRRFGAEPLGVFRWAGITYSALIDALDHRLEGIGDAEQTEVLLDPNNNEYCTQDRRYGMSMHTFILQGQMPADTVKEKMCRRLQYLKAKLLEDFSDTERIFVFNSRNALDDEALAGLRRALEPYGPTPLMHVAPHPEFPPGAVIEVGDRIWRGSVRRTGYDGQVWDVEYDDWQTICANMTRILKVSSRS